MKKFESSYYFSKRNDDAIIEPSNFFIARPTSEGLDLVIQYLNNKYQATICRPLYGYSLGSHFSGEPNYIRMFSRESQSDTDINRYLSIAKMQNQENEFRQAFIFGDCYIHSAFMVYVRQGNKEAILYSDSTGAARKFVEDLSKQTKINVFYTSGIRQTDSQSCYNDALVMARDTSGFNPKTKQYLLPNLLSLLEERAKEESEGVFLTTLPSYLLKTVQYPRFYEEHMKKNNHEKDILVHKDHTIDSFRQRYSQDAVIKSKDEKASSEDIGKKIILSNYLQKKSWKFVQKMQIQFYLNQIEEGYSSLSHDESAFFIAQSKEILQSPDSSLHDFANEFLNNLLKNKPETHQFNEKMQEYPLTELSFLEKDQNLINFYSNLMQAIDKIDKCDFPHLFFENEGKSSPEEEKALELLKDKTFGFLVTKLLLEKPPKKLSSIFWLAVARINLEYANLLLENQTLIKQLAKHELFYFGHSDPYLAKKLINSYPNFFNKKQQKALQWIATYTINESSIA